MMMELWNNLSLTTGDILLGWLLAAPRDIFLVVFALAAATVLIVLRRLFSNQRVLRHIADDETMLRRLRRDARKSNDRQAVDRFRQTRLAIARLRLRQEVKLSLLSLVPLAVMLTWASARLAYFPPAPREKIVFSLTTPDMYFGEITHVVPQPGIRSENGWVKTVEVAPADHRRRGQATWRLRFEPGRKRRQITVRIGEHDFIHEIEVGANCYAPPSISHAPGFQTRCDLRPYRPFGAAPSWWIAWIAITLPAYYLVKRISRTS